jgi:hypothetical protein
VILLSISHPSRGLASDGRAFKDRFIAGPQAKEQAVSLFDRAQEEKPRPVYIFPTVAS